MYQIYGHFNNRGEQMGRLYGYVRIWPYRQDEENQLITLHEMRVSDRDIYIDRQTEPDSDFREYQKLLEKIKTDDLLYIKSLDVLGAEYREIGRQWRILTKEKKADVVVLDMPQLDTRRAKTQFDTLVADLVLSMLEYAPGIEYSIRKQKQKEGIAKAKHKGIQFGRPEMPLPDNFDQICQMWQKKEIKSEKAAELCNISRSLFYRKVRERKKTEQMQGRL